MHPACVFVCAHWRLLLSESDSVALNLDLGADLYLGTKPPAAILLIV